MTTQFFIPMQSAHHYPQRQRAARLHEGRASPAPVLHDSSELKAARAKLHAYLAPHAPGEAHPGRPSGAAAGQVDASPPRAAPDGSWRTTKPDTDNLEKALKDEMTRLHFWHDDAQVCSEIVEKFWAGPLRRVRPGGGADMTYEEKKAWLCRYRTAEKYELL